MWWRRIIYGLVTLGAFAFYLFSGQWMAWILLLAMIFLPLISLLLSLPSMLLTKIQLFCPESVPINSQVSVQLIARCPFSTPPLKWKLTAYENFSGSKLGFSSNAVFLADHCGAIKVSLKKIYVSDYLGLISLPKKCKLQKKILVIPHTLPIRNIPSLKKYLASRWKPKPGGGFSEHYDLREYHPGDDLRQIHWKLASKTGKIILREPTIPVRGKLALSLSLFGSADVIDRKFGKLLYLSDYFLSRELPFEIHCSSGEGIRCFPVITSQDFSSALHTLLQSSLATEEHFPVPKASWHYRIGGEAHEE